MGLGGEDDTEAASTEAASTEEVESEGSGDELGGAASSADPNQAAAGAD